MHKQVIHKQYACACPSLLDSVMFCLICNSAYMYMLCVHVCVYMYVCVCMYVCVYICVFKNSQGSFPHVYWYTCIRLCHGIFYVS